MFTLTLLPLYSSIFLNPVGNANCLVTFSGLLLGSLLSIPVNLPQGCEYFNSFIQFDYLSYSLIVLTLLIQFLLISVSLVYGEENFSSYQNLLNLLFLTIIGTFLSSSLLEFYLYFEAALFPIFILVLMWGYQPERMNASLILLFYTSVASLPLLLIILNSNFSSFFISSFFFKTQSCNILNEVFQILILIATLINIPVFGPHQWLPNAHVEAPVEGSMVLAAILLNLGGYGLIRIFLFTPSISLFSYCLAGLSLVGSSLISVVCAYQFDINILIAYSSVAHISLVIVPLLTKSLWGVTASFAVMVAHGFASSLLFAIANLLYRFSGSRSVLLTKSTLLVLPFFTSLWFLACAANLAGPFTFNLVAELIAVVSLMNIDFICVIPFSVIIFIAAVYSLGLYSLTQHGNFQLSSNSGFLLSFSDLLIITTHLYFTYSVGVALNLFL